VTDAAGLKAALTAALMARGTVRKRREIYLHQNVRVHLDEVAGLGTFVEFEAVLSTGDHLAQAQSLLDRLCRLLGIVPEDCIGSSYADLMGLR
jgi:predicted adenylyl cyclase CyaB